MDWIVENLAHISKIVGYLTALAGFCYGLWKWACIPIYKHFKAFGTLNKQIETIYLEVTPNGGGSIKDAIKRIESNYGEIEAKLISLQNIQDAYREDGPIGIFECATTGENLYVNRTYARWLGASKSDLLKLGWVNFVPKEDRESYRKAWKNAFEDGRELEMPMKLIRSDKKEIYCNIWAYPIINKDGTVVQYLGIINKVDRPEELIPVKISP
jgi:PAS domain S-box-containing protein